MEYFKPSFYIVRYSMNKQTNNHSYDLITLVVHARFNHWDYRTSDWSGSYNLSTGGYDSIDHANINRSLAVVEAIVRMYKDEPAVQGIEPANEPWQNIPIEIVKDYYWRSYVIVRKLAPSWIVLFHVHSYIYIYIYILP